MKAMVLEKAGQKLSPADISVPDIKKGQVLIKVSVCGICRTDLHVVDGELDQPKLPLVPGHQIIGIVVKKDKSVDQLHIGQRVGVPWLGGTCGCCDYCIIGKENLCDSAIFTGYQANGGFAEYTAANADFCFPIPEIFSDLQAAPLLCAGLIGYRSYRPAMAAERIGLYGFGAAAHILIQVIKYNGQQAFVFTRPGDHKAQEFARDLGACWAGDSTQSAPRSLDAAIIFAPVGNLVKIALGEVRKGGKVICAGIHMSDIPSIPYSLLWGERSIESIANLTRADGEEFFPLAARIPIRTEVHPYNLAQVNQALEDLRYGKFTGAAVIQI